MSDIVSPLLQWLNANPHYAGLVTFVISAAESVAIIGTIVPGSIMMTALGALAGAGVIPLWATIIWAILGAIVGDGISYWIGHYFKDRLRKIWPFNRNPHLLLKGETFFLKYGSMSVFIGRFVGPVRALVPLVAGMLGMKPLQFTIANVTSAIFWAPAYMLPGILLGAASLELPPEIAVHVILVIFLLTLFILLCLWFTYKLTQWILRSTHQMQYNLWLRLKSSRTFSPIVNILKHHNEILTYDQLGLAFYFLSAIILFVLLALYVKTVGAPNIMINEIAFHLFRGIQMPGAYIPMLNITLLGQKEVISPIILTLFIWLFYINRKRAAWHVLALGIVSAGSLYVTKHIIQLARPWGILQSPETYSMPSGHATMSTCIYFGIAFLIAASVAKKRHWMIYSVAVFLVGIVCLSRLYLGAHWLTDIIAAWLLSIAVLSLIIISYRRKQETPISPWGLLIVTFLTLIVTTSIYHHYRFEKMEINYAQIDYPTEYIDIEAWWNSNNVLPAYRASLFGFPSEYINLEWEGEIDDIRDTLLKAGWNKPPARDFISTLHRLSDVKSTLYLPLVSPQYLDKKPELILTRQVNHEKNLLVLRLWSANRILRPDDTALWVGMVGIIPRSYSWLYTTQRRDLKHFAINADLIFPTAYHADWEWKMMTRITPKKRRTIVQNILLIRKKTTAKT